MKLFALAPFKTWMNRLSKVLMVGILATVLGFLALPAQAMPSLKIGNPDLLATGSKAAGAVEMDRAKGEIDEMWGEGSHESVEGKIQETLGGAKRRVGDLTDDADTQAEGASDIFKGRAKYNKGQAESALDDVREKAEDSTQGIIENVKDIFR